MNYELRITNGVRPSRYSFCENKFVLIRVISGKHGR